jgi:hypothetical protein
LFLVVSHQSNSSIRQKLKLARKKPQNKNTIVLFFVIPAKAEIHAFSTSINPNFHVDLARKPYYFLLSLVNQKSASCSGRIPNTCVWQ